MLFIVSWAWYWARAKEQPFSFYECPSFIFFSILLLELSCVGTWKWKKSSAYVTDRSATWSPKCLIPFVDFVKYLGAYMNVCFS